VDNDCTSDDILNLEAVGKHRAPCVAVVSEERREVARVVRMLAVAWVKMTARIGKRIPFVSRTAFAFMNMEAENIDCVSLAAGSPNISASTNTP
jgi:hypothetical protein